MVFLMCKIIDLKTIILVNPYITMTKDTDYSYLRLPENKIIFEYKENFDKKFSDKIQKWIDKGHNILYNSENIESDDALNDIMNFLFLRMIQNIISDKKCDGKIDLLNKSYYTNLYDDDDLEKILSYFKNLNNLANAELKDIRCMDETTDAIRQMGEILKTHPITKMIYTENNFIRAKKATTIQLLLNDVILAIDINLLHKNEDVIGDIYEHIINKYVKKGSKLGQFFTPRKLMNLILLNKKDIIDTLFSKIKGNIKVYDSCMGTGGWLVTTFNMFKDKYGKRILLSGGEVKPSTFQYGLMNLITTLNKFPSDVRCESSLTHINKEKHHLTVTNPPFKTDFKFGQIVTNMKSDLYTKKNKINVDDVYELKDNNPPIQFLELDLYKLENNGMCIIVLPYGELFFSNRYTNARKHFMEKVNITDIILVPGGIFTHTRIKTCVLIFENNSKGTKEIKFTQINKECNTITHITTVSITDIQKDCDYSWYHQDYLVDEYIVNLYTKMPNYEWIEFGKVFELVKGTLQSSKVEENEDGEILFISKAEVSEDKRKINSINFFNSGVFIAQAFNGNGRCPIKYINEKCIHSNLMFKINIKNDFKEILSEKFIFYYLKLLQEHIEYNYDKGSCNKSLDQKNFYRIKIPIPQLNYQKKIENTLTELDNLKEFYLNKIKEVDNKITDMLLNELKSR